MPRATAPLHYAIDLSRPGHEVAVTLTIPDPQAMPGPLRLYMPSWAPGSYLIREFGRLVERFAATQEGRAVPWHASAEDEWTVEPASSAPLEVEYTLYAHELTVRTNYLGPERALLCGSATFLVPEGREHGAFTFEVRQPAGWPEVQCALPERDGRFEAASYDELVDAPVAAGPCQVADFDVHGVPHRIAVYGPGVVDMTRLTRETEEICAAAAGVLDGRIPCSRYLFIIELGASGGLEHANSSVCGFPAIPFASEAAARREMSLVAHEYFHLWNIKRIRPQALGPFDYRRENFTPHLWVAEGLTSYYQHVIPRRAGHFGPARWLAIMAAYLVDLERTPGRHLQSAEESSHHAWVKFYRQGENARNSQVSYYGKGAVIGLALDLDIVHASGGRATLDDVFRALWTLHLERPERGFTDGELRDAIATAAGRRLDESVDELARGRSGVDLDARLERVGLSLERVSRRGGGWLGLTLRKDGGRALIDRVQRDSPAWEAGLAPSEEVVGINGFRCDEGDLADHLDLASAGEAVTLTTALYGRLREVRATVAARPSVDFRFRKLARATPEAKARFASWLGIAWDAFEPLDEKPEEQRSGRAPREV